ncbi:competence protein CelA [Lentilactobacillus fungorum]|uniref:Competence protein CelA n=1 Tax=Lentilactobacillus fungorum TaxID=2201250 RepID=A0ABQ3W443_9LACO|nr:helix-hairpin-helix domain-containing protein [Lentilactobacillus fungorum]GHP15061.1 competence protein CelA [Lentilactobacillus fungorum]
MNRIREFIDDYLYQILIGLVSVIVIFMFVIGGLILKGGSKATVDDTTSISETATSQSSTSQMTSQESTRQMATSSSGTQQMYVDVKGAVKNPGVYQINANMRVVDAIHLAGGYNRSADRKQINLAQKLSDQQVIYVPIRGEKHAPNTSTMTPQSGAESTGSDTGEAGSSTTATSGQSGEQINLNTADKAKLQELSGIGDKKADQIIAYRQAHGQFKKIEELKDVPGFGDKTFDNLKSSICV